MLGTMPYGPRDVRCEDVHKPKILKPTDAIIRLWHTCDCGSDLWPYRDIRETSGPQALGHEYCSVVEEVGSAVETVKPSQFVVGSFCLSETPARNAASGSGPPASSASS